MSCCCECARSGGPGAALGVIVLGAFEGVSWVLAHLAEVAIVSAACGVLAVAAVAMVMRWADRRDSRPVALWAARVVPRIGKPVTVLAAVAEPVRQAIEPAPKSWLCETCYWVWPDTTPFCGICGGSRASHGAAREVIVRQAIGKEV